MTDPFAALAGHASVALVVPGTGDAGPRFVTGHVERGDGTVALRMPGGHGVALRPEWASRLRPVGDLLAVAVLHGALWMIVLEDRECEDLPDVAALEGLMTAWPGARD